MEDALDRHDERRAPAAGVGRLGVYIFCFLLAVELLFYSGRFHSLDEMALLGTTESLVKWHRADINSMAWAQWFLPGADQQGLFSQSGDLYAKKAPLVSWLCLPLYALAGICHGRQVQASLLLNALVVAATAALLFRLARRLGFGLTVSCGGALLFGLGTNALVYARYLFSEPLAGLGLLLAVEGVWRHQAGDGDPPSALVQAGCGLGLALLSNLVYLAFVPVFLLFLLWPPSPTRSRAKAAGTMLWPVVLALAALGLWNGARFGNPWTSGYHWKTGEGFSSPLWITIPALLASPARGLLFFVPASMLSVPGAVLLLRRQRRLGLLLLALTAAHLLLFGAWWMWWSGWGWGPRFLAPAAPLLVLLALPVLESALAGRRLQKAAVVAVCTVSVAVQVLGATVGFDEHELALTLKHLATGPEKALYPYGMDGLWNIRYSPILGHARLLASGSPDLAWRPGGRTDWMLLLPLLAWSALSGQTLFWALRGKLRRWSRPGVLLAGSTLLIVLLLWRAGQHPLRASYGMDPTSGATALSEVAGRLQPGDGVLMVRSLLATEMDAFPSFAPVYGIPDGGLAGAGWNADLDRFLLNARTRHDRLWIIARSEKDPFAARIETWLGPGRRSSGWSPVDGYEIAAFGR